MKRRFLKVAGILLAASLLMGQVANTKISLKTVYAQEEDTTKTKETLLQNGDFESKTVDGFEIVWEGTQSTYTVKSPGEDSQMTGNSTSYLNFWNGAGEENTLSITQKVTGLEPGIYTVAVDAEGAGDIAADLNLVAGNKKTAITTTAYNVWNTFTINGVVVGKDGAVLIGITGTTQGGYWGDIDNFTLIKEQELPKVINGTFETGDLSGWKLEDSGEVVNVEDAGTDTNATKALHIYNGGNAVPVLMSQTITGISKGTYQVTLEAEGMEGDSGMKLSVAGKETSIATKGWGNWLTVKVSGIQPNEKGEIVITITGTVPAGYWGHVDNIALSVDDGSGDGSGDGGTEDEDTTVDSNIFVEKVKGLSDDFIQGADISSYYSVIESGATFKDWQGNELDEVGFFALLKESGVNYVRIRIWNHPYDENGNGYGGGNTNLEKAIKMGQWATKAGLKVQADFHYSDFWADPSRQLAPKAWTGFTVKEKETALYDFTKTSLNALLDAGVDVGMVQVGHETNTGVAGVSGWDNMCKVFSAGSKAVREISTERGKEILVALHFTNPSDEPGIAGQLAKYNVDYDIFASSYYSFWHGTLNNLTNVLTTIAQTYNKKVMIAEISYAFTWKDGDGQKNAVRKDNEVLSIDYDISPQGQADAVRDAVAAVAKVGEKGIGVFYWEPAWLPVQVYDETALNAAEVLASNQISWETHGSGWATKAASMYDPNNVGTNYGGTEWDNQALFDFNGNPLPSLNVFKYVHTGAKGELAITSMEEPKLEFLIGEKIVLPDTVTVLYNDRSTKEVAVTWNQEQLEAVQKIGTYEIQGTAVTEKGEEIIKATVIVKPKNLLKNSGFEEGSTSDWQLKGEGVSITNEPNNARTGDWCLKFWNDEAFTFEATQTVSGLEPGNYVFTGYLQGGDAGTKEESSFILYAKSGESTWKETTTANGWKVFTNPKIEKITVGEDGTATLGVGVSGIGGAWGGWDDFYFYKVPDEENNTDEDKDDGTAGDKEDNSQDNGMITTTPEKLAVTLATVKEPAVVNVTMQENTVISAETWNYMVGRNITLQVTLKNGVKWKINGKNLTAPLNQKIDFAVILGGGTIPEAVKNGVTGALCQQTIEFAYHGSFNGTVELAVPLKNTLAGRYGNVFYYNEATGKIEHITSRIISTDGVLTTNYTQASSYVIYVSEKAMNQNSVIIPSNQENTNVGNISNTQNVDLVKNALPVKTGDTTIWTGYFILMAFAAIIMVQGYYKKRSNQNK
ncbi:MAG: glycosyl hydrolase 53 family protein [Lachnospiraceae bacterium]